MKVKDKIASIVLEKIKGVSLDIRSQEDLCKKFLVAPPSDYVYIGLVAYKQALVDILDDIRGINDNVRKGKDFSP